MKNISYQELANCQRYAEDVLEMYKKCNNGKTINSKSDAEIAIREYNSDFRKFKAMFGYSIRGYIDTIADCIGFMVEA